MLCRRTFNCMCTIAQIFTDGCRCRSHIKRNTYDTLGMFSRPIIFKQHLSSAFNFLHWKLRHHAVSFTTVDSHIVLSNDFMRFAELSSDCCSYTKHMINCNVESKRQSSVDNQWLLNGYSKAPIVSCEILFFNSFVNRITETLCLSFFIQIIC